MKKVKIAMKNKYILFLIFGLFTNSVFAWYNGPGWIPSPMYYGGFYPGYMQPQLQYPTFNQTQTVIVVPPYSSPSREIIIREVKDINDSEVIEENERLRKYFRGK